MDKSRFEIIPYDSSRSQETTRMWRSSKEHAQGFPEQFDFDSQHEFLKTKLSLDCAVQLVIEKASGDVVAMLATGIGTIEQLYVHLNFQGLGIGSSLLDMAKTNSPSGLKLYTLECNMRAQEFYEQHGFEILSRRFAEHEQVPDILYSWNGN